MPQLYALLMIPCNTGFPNCSQRCHNTWKSHSVSRSS